MNFLELGILTVCGVPSLQTYIYHRHRFPPESIFSLLSLSPLSVLLVSSSAHTLDQAHLRRE